MYNLQCLTFNKMVEWEDYVIGSDILSNDIYFLDIDTLKIIKTINLNVSEMLSDADYGYYLDIQLCGDWLNFFPRVNVRCVMSYNVLSGEIVMSSPIKDDSMRYGVITPGFRYKNYYIMLLPQPELICRVYDLSTRSWVEHDEKAVRIWKKLVSYGEAYMPYLFQKDAYFAVGIYKKDQLLLVDWEKEEVTHVTLPVVPASDMVGFSMDEQNYWVYFEGTDEIIRIPRDEEASAERIKIEMHAAFYPMIDCGKELLLCPTSEEAFQDIIVFRKDTYEIENLANKLPKDLKIANNVGKAFGVYTGYNMDDDYVYIFPGAVNMRLRVNRKDYSIEGKSIVSSEDRQNLLLQRVAEYQKDKSIVSESEVMKYGVYDNSIQYLMRRIEAGAGRQNNFE